MEAGDIPQWRGGIPSLFFCALNEEWRNVLFFHSEISVSGGGCGRWFRSGSWEGAGRLDDVAMGMAAKCAAWLDGEEQLPGFDIDGESGAAGDVAGDGDGGSHGGRGAAQGEDANVLEAAGAGPKRAEPADDFVAVNGGGDVAGAWELCVEGGGEAFECRFHVFDSVESPGIRPGREPLLAAWETIAHPPHPVNLFSALFSFTRKIPRKKILLTKQQHRSAPGPGRCRVFAAWGIMGRRLRPRLRRHRYPRLTAEQDAADQPHPAVSRRGGVFRGLEM